MDQADMRSAFICGTRSAKARSPEKKHGHRGRLRPSRAAREIPKIRRNGAKTTAPTSFSFFCAPYPARRRSSMWTISHLWEGGKIAVTESRG